MTTDNQKKYEEAAMEFIMENPFLMSGSAKSGFLSGASFAEKESEARISELTADRDYWRSQAWALLNEKRENLML